MVNVKVIRISDKTKYIVGGLFIILCIFFFVKGFSNEENKIQTESLGKVQHFLSSSTFTACIGQTLTMMESDSKQEKEKQEGESFTKKIMGLELSALNVKEKEQTQEVPIEMAKEEKTVSQEVETGLPTEVVDQSGINTKYTNEYGTVKVKNESKKYQLTEDILRPDIELSNKTDIILYHTHTCESYTPSSGYEYQASGNFRTTDLNFSVARVGTELANYLTGYGYHVIHDTTYHDYPAYTGSYTRSLTSVQKDLAANPNTQIVFDVHRDAVGSSNTYAPTVKIGEEYAAQIMFVVGTDGGGLSHPNWQQNLKFAVKVQEKANELYPGLMKPIILRDSRYNQHVTNAATIIEIGATGNTLDQCITSMKYFAKVLDEVLK